MPASTLAPAITQPVNADITQVQDWVYARIAEWQRVYTNALPWIDKSRGDLFKLTKDSSWVDGGPTVAPDWATLFADLKLASQDLNKVLDSTEWIVDQNIGLPTWDAGLKSVLDKLNELGVVRGENAALRAQLAKLQGAAIVPPTSNMSTVLTVAAGLAVVGGGIWYIYHQQKKTSRK